MFARFTAAYVLLGILFIFAEYPFQTNAQTSAQLQAQVELIRARVAQLRALLQGSEASTTPPDSSQASCALFTRTLLFGSRGEDVRGLQDFLISEKVLAEGSATGYFGPLTRAAVERWQGAQGIISYGTAATTGYGVVGPKTRAAIVARCNQLATVTSATAPAPPPAVPPSITITAPRGGLSVAGGDMLRIAWQSTSTPLGSTVSISLLDTAAKNLGILVRNAAVSAEYLWRVPPQTGSCGAGVSAFDCLMSIGGCTAADGICSLPSGVYRVVAVLSNGVSTTSPPFEIAVGTGSGILDSLVTGLGTSTFFGTSSQDNSSGAPPTDSCIQDGVLYSPGTTLSVPCSGNCPASGTGYITGSCTNTKWCIPYTTYCAASIGEIDTSAYAGGGAGAIGSGYAVSCPQEGWREYLSCPYGGCKTGWNICRGGKWVLDSVQQTYTVGKRGPCESGQLWCGIGYGFGCVASSQCVNGKAL